MAKKKNNIILENVELKPQTIGYSYKKKSNLGRVIIIFAIFILVIFYINDISVYVNKLLGRESAATIEQLADEKKIIIEHGDNTKKEDIVYSPISESLEMTIGELLVNNFSYNNNVLTFDIINYTNKSIDLSLRKFFVELYNTEKTLLTRIKLDINTINANSKSSYEFNVDAFDYIVIIEKVIDDYPEVSLTSNKITCKNGIENIEYNFNDNGLISIIHTITDKNVSSSNYLTNLSLYQNKANIYNNFNGINATFSSSNDGFTATFNIDLENANLSSITEKYYYAYKELAKVVSFEMQTYGFSCS